MRDAMKMIEEWLASSKAWLELESARLRLEAEIMEWEAENRVLPNAVDSYDRAFVEAGV